MIKRQISTKKYEREYTINNDRWLHVRQIVPGTEKGTTSSFPI